MNSKHRVHAALNRQPTDHVPVWMWFHPETSARLSAALEIPIDRVADALGDDIRQAWVGNNHAMEGIAHQRDGDGHTDAWGIQWVKQGPFNQIRSSPLRGAGVREILVYEYPYDHVDELMDNMTGVMASSGEYFVGADTSPCVYEMVCRLRGMEDATRDLAASPRLARTLLEQAGRFAVHLARTACERFALDWLWTGDDVGGQHGMIMSPACWRGEREKRCSVVDGRFTGRGQQGRVPDGWRGVGAGAPVITSR